MERRAIRGTPQQACPTCKAKERLEKERLGQKVKEAAQAARVDRKLTIESTVRTMTAAGHSQTEIAKVLGMHHSAISWWQKKLGLKPAQKCEPLTVDQKATKWKREAEKARERRKRMKAQTGMHSRPRGRPTKYNSEEDRRDAVRSKKRAVYQRKVGGSR